jgi:transposase/predicted nucleic acid-binding Zn finger protein
MKGKAHMSDLTERELKALEIAAKAKLQRSGDRWFVPAQTGKRGTYYTVKPDPAQPHCTCPDFESRKLRCKHIFAVEYTIEREQTSDGESVVTETLRISRKTYSQDWPSYNKAQTNEKEQFQKLLHELCNGIGEPSQNIGRPRVPLDDMIFSAAFKVYSTVSARRFMCDLHDSHTKGYISRVPCYNTIFKYFESELLTPHLQLLIEESALPLQAVESAFAVDSSGFSTSRFIQWVQAKHHNPKLLEKRDWVKVHLMCGVKTNVVTAVEITDRFAADAPRFKSLVDATAQNFVMSEVCADKAYLSAANLQVVADHSAMPYIPFKSNSASEWGLSGMRGSDKKAKWQRKSDLWRQMYHYYEFNQQWFMQRYHQRSNVESTFSMIKAKFGDSLRSKTKTAQVNEALCKILCHNLCCLIQSMYELEIKPEFWQEP